MVTPRVLQDTTCLALCGSPERKAFKLAALIFLLYIVGFHIKFC